MPSSGLTAGETGVRKNSGASGRTVGDFAGRAVVRRFGHRAYRQLKSENRLRRLGLQVRGWMRVRLIE